MSVVGLCLLAILSLASAVPGNRDRIPNGHSVPHPCDALKIWAPVGHLVSDPREPNAINLNPFGQEFRSSHLLWTKGLCHKDSDGDGKSNGEELGDPHCRWSIGRTPDGQATGHPGINEKTFPCLSSIG